MIGADGADSVLRHFSKHCIRGHNHSCNPGGQAPRPPTARRNSAVSTKQRMIDQGEERNADQ